MTDKKMADILSNITIVIDTREQKNQHIKDYFDEKEIPYIEKKLNAGDYTFILPKYPDLELDGTMAIERKNSLDEITGNLSQNRERFIKEFERAKDIELHLMIEKATWRKLFRGSYRSKMSPQSFLASLLTWHYRYKCPIWFVQQDESGILIYNLIKYYIMEKLKNV